jgi:DNA transformation protein
MSYWRLPEAALDDPELASEWAKKALAAARSKATAKPKPKKKRKT